MAYNEDKQRSRTAKAMENKLKERAAYEHGNRTSHDHWTDDEIIDKYLEEESQRQAYEHDRR